MFATGIRYWLGRAGLVPLLGLLLLGPTAHSQLVISEFAAANSLGLKDDDGDYEDWIEIHNPSSFPVSLADWTLTDSPATPRLWTCPNVTVAPSGFVVVFASGKDRRETDHPLHTNFRLSTSGEYLALRRPDGSVATEFSPAYPPQVADVSFGFPVSSSTVPLVTAGAAARLHVPANDVLSTNWVRPDFDDTPWTPVRLGIGWDATGDTTQVVVADSVADWNPAGQQGDRGWSYGSYARFSDANASYSAAEFVEFGPGNWDGLRWRTPVAGTALVTLGASEGTPAGSNNGGERWAIRRWRATVAGDLNVQWRVTKRAPGGNGLNVRLYQNGVQRDSVVLGNGDTTPVTRAVKLTGVALGEPIDLALTPLGAGSVTDDVGDAASFSMTITAPGAFTGLVRTDVAGLVRGRNASAYLRLPFVVTNIADLDQLELRVQYDDGFALWLNGAPITQRNAPVATTGGVVADQSDDWAGTDDQGVKGWYYGYYDASGDGDHAYDPFTDFNNVDPFWAWNGSAWTLGPSDPPWTTITRDTWHPNGNDGGANVHWAIRRWVSQTAGTVKVLLAGAKENVACGNGVTYRVLVNGRPKFTRSLAANDAAGFVTTLLLENLNLGDFVDFALDPTGPDGATGDGCDGSTFTAQILQDPSPGLVWNSPALTNRAAADTVRVEAIDLSRARDRLVPGTNVLAVHLLNASADDADFLFAPELNARYAHVGARDARYFTAPTPGTFNVGGAETLGPVIERVDHSPAVPTDTDDLVVTAVVRRTLRDVASVTLMYRVLFTAEKTLPMYDDGRHDDAGAGDGIWGARIPASAAAPGQMIRWAVTASDTAGAALRFPPYPDPRKSPQYDGTVVLDPTLADSRIPVLHWFIVDPGAADTDAGGRGSLFFDGEFYDNVLANVHGQSTRGFPKHSYDFDFNPGHKFRWRTGQPRVDDFNLLTTWADKAHLRNVLAYETYEEAGAPAHFALAVRIQQNAKFHSVANLVENGDDNFLRRLGLDPQGALYKMYNTASDVSGGEKKTRKNEGTQDLGELIRGFSAGTASTRQAFLFDNLDVPGVVNFLAARAITGDTDCCHKNYYLYRDTNDSGEWTAFPWDVDLSFGRVWTCGNPCLAYYDETIYTNTALFVGDNNTVFSLVLNNPATRQMYLRRVRTLMDDLTQPPTVAPAEDHWLLRTTHWRDRIAPDAARDLAKWGTWGRRETITQAVDRIHREFLPGRRRFLFNTRAGGALPLAQPTNAEIRIVAFESRTTTNSPGTPDTTGTDYLTLTNANAFAVDISDWRLEGSVRFRFKPGTVLPARSNAFVVARRADFRRRSASPKGGESRLVLGDYTGELSTRGGNVALYDRYGRTVQTATYPGVPSAAQRFLRVTEIHFHPADTAPGTAFIELANFGPETLDLAGIRFVDGVTFDFTRSAVTNLAPSARVLVVANLVAFRAKYGPLPRLAGEYVGGLDGGGERLRLVDANSETILDFRFDPDAAKAADGLGFSLVQTRPEVDATAWGDPPYWRASRAIGGSPGTDESGAPSLPAVVINEVLSHTDPPLVDAVELHNPTTEPADLGGWWLTDDPTAPAKYRLPTGTILPAGGYLVLDESQFNSPSNAPTSFRLSSHGDDVWLFSADRDGALTGYATGAEFGAAANGVTFGRHTNSLGVIRYIPQATPTLGAPNREARVGPVVLNEIHFAPARGDLPFIELRNTSDDPVPLFDPAAPTNTWRLAGVDFSFPPGLTLPPRALLVVAGGDPDELRALHGITADVAVLGPWPGTLQANGERLALERPDAPDLLPDGGVFVPYLTVDEVRFRDRDPWPVTVATPGASLERTSATTWADDPRNWRASSNGPTPGLSGSVNRPPVVSAGPDQSLEASRFPLSVTLVGRVTDDGLPADPGRASSQWTQVDGPGVVEFDDAQSPAATARLPGPGHYVLKLAASDGEASASASISLTVQRPGADQTPIPAGTRWRYFAAGREPAAGWRDVDFDDQSWPIGEAQLGYGDGDERTVLEASPNGAKLLTAYFRRAFPVDAPAAVQSLTLRLLRDDGAALWLNGQPAFRSNLPEGPLTYSTLASTAIAGVDESTFVEQALDPTLLRAGTNVIAVEIHQQSEGSSDISFDLELRLTAAPVNQVPSLALAEAATATVGRAFALAPVWSDDGLPQVATFDWRQLSGPGVAQITPANAAATRVSLPVAGAYELRLTLSDGAATVSRNVRLTAVAEGDPEAAAYQAWRQTHFTAPELAQPAVSGDAADPDDDGQSNLAEFRSGTDPRNRHSVLALSASTGPGGELRLDIQVVAGRTYRVEWASALAPANWQELRKVDTATTTGVVTVIDPGPGLATGGRFYRVVTP